MTLRVPVPVTKILKSKSPVHTKWHNVRRHYKNKIRSTAGCFTEVLIAGTFVLKRDMGRGSECSVVKDYKYIDRVRKSNPKMARHLPVSRLYGNILVQERCDVNPELYRQYNRQIVALGALLGISDIHEYNIGWKYVKGEPVPVFIDVGFRRPPAKLGRNRAKGKKLSWFLTPAQMLQIEEWDDRHYDRHY